jgi:hypothetical protein
MDLRETGCRVHYNYSRLPLAVLVQPYSSATAVRSDVSHDCASVGTTTNSHTNSTTARMGKFPVTTFCSLASKFSAQLLHFFPLHIQNMRQLRCTGQNALNNCASQAHPEQKVLCMEHAACHPSGAWTLEVYINSQYQALVLGIDVNRRTG